MKNQTVETAQPPNGGQAAILAEKEFSQFGLLADCYIHFP